MRTRILLLEDDTFCLGLLETVLLSEGYDVIVCDSPDDVVEHSQRDPTALALVDFWGRSQLVLTAKDRAHLVRLTSSVPTILVTARSWAEKCEPADLGLMAVIVKPFGLAELFDTVARCMALVNERVASRAQSGVSDMCA